MLAFAAATLFLIITPGPGVLTTAGVGSAYGFYAGTRFLAGLFVGTNLTSLAVISGLAAVVLSVPGLRGALLVASLAYLFYLAWRIAFSGSRIAFIESPSAPGFSSGVLLQLINPKAYAVNTMLFSGFAFWPESLALETAAKLLIMNLLWVPVHFLWLWAGVSLRKLNLSGNVQFAVNLAMALAMLAVVALATLSQLNQPT